MDFVVVRRLWESRLFKVALGRVDLVTGLLFLVSQSLVSGMSVQRDPTILFFHHVLPSHEGLGPVGPADRSSSETTSLSIDCFRKVIHRARNLKTQIPISMVGEFVFLCHTELAYDSSLPLPANPPHREEMTWPGNNSHPHIQALELISSLSSTQYKPLSNCVT